ncbi:hypothetical protein GQ457_18G009980 [Hibiscus cannabinus]
MPFPVGSRLWDAGLSDGACPLCGSGLEDTLHALRDCPDSSLALRQADSSHHCCCSPRWRPPPTGSVKINVDGAFLPTARLGAIGVLARDSSGAVLGGFARPIPVIGPASAVEASALFAGLEFAIANGWASALIEFDAAVLVNKLHRPTPDLSLLGDLLAPSRHLIAASCGRLRVGFAPRPANSAAHTLASWACQHNDVDGAFLPTARLGAIGVLARDSSGTVLGGFTQPTPVIGPASAVEASALFAALSLPLPTVGPRSRLNLMLRYWSTSFTGPPRISPFLETCSLRLAM